jgi:radical SAM-linked protein
MSQRLRLLYAVDGPIRYASHLDQMRIWERAARRAGLPLAYSAGFTPHPQIHVAAALPVGVAGWAEWLDLWLEQPVDPTVARAALSPQLPAGLTIRDAFLADPAEPALPAQVRAAEYHVSVETTEPVAEVRRRVESLLAAESLPRQRRGRSYDLRPLLQRLWVEGEGEGTVLLGMVLSAREGATGRPDEVLDALGLAGGFFQIERRALRLAAEGR